MHHARLQQILLIALVGCGAAAAAAPAPMEFPGRVSMLASPDGKSRIINRDDESKDEAHLLLLNAHGVERPLYRYGRHVLVAWSPDSRRVAITDYAGSNAARCIVIDAKTLKSTDVTAEATGRSKLISRIMGNFHAYFECQGWTSDHTLSIKVSGYGDSNPHGAEIRQEFQLKPELATTSTMERKQSL